MSDSESPASPVDRLTASEVVEAWPVLDAEERQALLALFDPLTRSAVTGLLATEDQAGGLMNPLFAPTAVGGSPS